ncbi:MAG TPA: hypothetical protein VFG51_04040 [Candidatus Saccharimonadia bacterium]|nr:hypothetical protein [Candidatus Saccharimonadia bacterium]
MTSSLPNKLFDGQTGFPTPNAPPEENGCRVFRIPSDEEWFALFMNAALRLTYEWAWYKNGTMTQAEAAAAWSDIIERAYDVSLTGECAEDVPAPYWDTETGDDADDTMDVLDQIWYGEIVTTTTLIMAEDVTLSFLDNLGIWLIAGFIAYAGQPAAAIAFVPIARRFVLYFKKSPTGAIVNILADFLHIADIDTYGVEDEVGTLLVTMPEDATTLYVVQADESNPSAGDSPNMNIIRSRLSEDNFSNPAYRYNVDCDCIQFSPDGGTTWNDAPGADMRHADAFRMPARGGSDIQCSAAANAECWLQTYIENVITLLEEGAIVVAVVNKLLQFVELIFAETGGELLNLILAVSGTIFDIGGGALAAAFTSDQWPILLCAIYCNMAGDGQVSAARLATMKAQVTANMNTTAALVVNLLLDTQGEVGVSNAGAIGEETADCSDCGCAWCRTYLSGDGLGDWIVPYDILGNAGGTYSSLLDQIVGTSINEENNVWASAYLSGALRVTEISVSFTFVNEGGSGSDTSSLNIFLDGVRHFTTYTGGTGSSSYTWTGDETVTTSIGFLMTAQVAMHVTCIELRGFETPPASGRDCS